MLLAELQLHPSRKSAEEPPSQLLPALRIRLLYTHLLHCVASLLGTPVGFTANQISLPPSHLPPPPQGLVLDCHHGPHAFLPLHHTPRGPRASEDQGKEQELQRGRGRPRNLRRAFRELRGTELRVPTGSGYHPRAGTSEFLLSAGTQKMCKEMNHPMVLHHHYGHHC